MAHKLAILSPRVTADVIEANEFADLSERYHVHAVPKTVINDRVEFDGSYPEPMFLQQLRAALAAADDATAFPAGG